MSFARILIIGVLALAVIYFIATAIAALVPYAFGLFLIWMAFVYLQNYFSQKDQKKK